MTQLWNTLLKDFTLPESNSTHGVIPLTDHTLLSITGVNAIPFLQGQCTCDFNQLAKNEWLLGAHCSAKGRMQSSFVAAQLSSDHILLRVHASIAEAALKNLQKYALFSKVKCELSPYVAAAIVGPIEGLGLEDLANHQFQRVGDAIALKHDSELTEIWFAAEDSLWPKLKAQPHLPTPLWYAFMIDRGQAEVQIATMDSHIPQEFNFDLTQGISFKKGCYTGQEIVARVHYRGQSKKRLQHFELNTKQNAAPPAIGSAIVNSEGKALGEVVAAVGLGDVFKVLATAPLDHNDEPAERLFLDGQMDTPLVRHALPYAIP